jgi:hypothetical protein
MTIQKQARFAYRNASSLSNDGDITMGDAVGDSAEDKTLLGTGGHSDIQLIDEEDNTPEDLTKQVQCQFDALIEIVSELCLNVCILSKASPLTDTMSFIKFDDVLCEVWLLPKLLDFLITHQNHRIHDYNTVSALFYLLFMYSSFNYDLKEVLLLL